MNYLAILAIAPIFLIVFILIPILFGKQIIKNIFEAWFIGFIFVSFVLGLSYLMTELVELASWGIINL
jgi:hypothetical protein